MPRKYDKKTKANFRAGRRNSRRLSMRVNMVSPVLSMFDDEFDPAIDDTMLMLKARGMDRERERFAEALTEVRDRISKIVDDYDAMLEESAHIYKDYIDELQEQVSVMPGSKLKHNILRILSDYKFVCAEREELLHALQESMDAQKNCMKEVKSLIRRIRSKREIPAYFDDDDEFDFYTSDLCLRDYTKTLRWFSEKFKDMDAKVCMLKKRESKGDKKRSKKEKQKEKAKAVENVAEKLEPANSKERLDTWKYAAEEIVDLLKTVRQEGEGGKDILAGELQKISNIMSKQNEEIQKKTDMLQKEKEATLRMKKNRDRLQLQIRTLEDRLKAKQDEVTNCKQYIQDIVKKMKNAPGEIKFSLEDVDEDDLQDELPTVMRRRFTLTESSLEDDFAKMKMKDAQKKSNDLQEENSRLQGEVTKLGEALVQKDREFAELKSMFSEGVGLPCPKCQRLTGTPGSENDSLTPEKEQLEVLEQKLRESESKLESTVVELARMRINLASSGVILPSFVNVSSQTRASDDQISNEDESDRYGSSYSSLNEEMEAPRSESSLVEFVITEPSPFLENSVDEAEVTPQEVKRSSKKRKTRKQEKGGEKSKKTTPRKDHSRKPTARREPHSELEARNDDEIAVHEQQETREETDRDLAESRNISSKKSIKMENKAVQTIHAGGTSSVFGRSPLARDVAGSIPGSIADARERMDDLREEIASLTDGKIELDDTGWRGRLQKLCKNIEEMLDETKAGGQLERVLSSKITGEKMKGAVAGDNRHDFRITEGEIPQYASKKRKSIFMRLVENNYEKRGSLMPDVAAPIQDTFGRYSRARSIHTPQYMNIIEEPDTDDQKTGLPAQKRPKTSKYSSHDTPAKSDIPKQTAPRLEKSKKSHHDVQHSGEQVGKSEKQTTGGLKQTPPKHSDSHPPSHPKDDMKGKVRRQSLTFSGEDEVNARYSKPFGLRRRSVFGHAGVIEKLASATGLDNAGLSGESKYLDGGQTYQRNDGYYDGQQDEFIRALSRGRGDGYRTSDPSTPERGFDENHLRYRKMSRGRFRPSMHPFIGLSEEDRASLTNIYNTRQNAGSRFGRRTSDYDEDESEIEVGTLMSDFRRDSLRKAFLSLGLMHLKGRGDDVKADERLTMEDQVNIVAEMAMEVLKATCDVFSKTRRQSHPIPNQQYFKKPDEEDELERIRGIQSPAILPPVNSPENRPLIFEDEPKDDPDKKNKEISLPEIPSESPAKPVEQETPSVYGRKPDAMRRSRQGSEQKQRDFLANYAAKRRSVNRSHPFRNFNARKTVMERILGSKMSALGNVLGQENFRYGAMRTHRNSLSRRPVTGDENAFSLTAQAIKLPSTSPHSSFHPIAQPTLRKGIPKSPSVGAQGLSGGGALSFSSSIAKAKSDQTHNRLFIGSKNRESSKWPAGKLRHTGIRKRL
ncbi:uncharacterized protein LOC114524978 [Dendronephthya gigantea]|uniref:uncharacterized protein LOC114524978 n=1 Tax=Dendronephthya gigantea TaxID=151771 RepID=UPI00106D17F8|nr:uncharacterized protein LOC114524978 [Dendronephthya gigantea]